MSLRRQQAAAILESPSPVNNQNKGFLPYPLFLLHMQAQKKKLSKRKRRNRDFALCGARRGLRVPPSRRRRHTCFAYVSIPLLNTFCRLAATSANKVPRPSNHSVATAIGSKRSSADSDLPLCHVRLWQTSRLELGACLCANIAK